MATARKVSALTVEIGGQMLGTLPESVTLAQAEFRRLQAAEAELAQLLKTAGLNDSEAKAVTVSIVKKLAEKRVYER